MSAFRRESDISATDGQEAARFEFDAGSEHEGQRLDRFLAAALPELSRARLQGLVRDGFLRQDGRSVAEPGRRVKSGEHFELLLPPARPALPRPETIPLEILFEDEHLLVLVKPAGLVVHPAAGHASGTLVNALLAHCAGSLSGIGGVERPGIVHRLDREVSGVMVVAKHDRAHVGLAGQFSVHRIERAYEAIVWGVPRLPAGTVEAPVGRHATDRRRMAVVHGPAGKRAVTHWRLQAAAGTRAARLAFRLETGRTHQIRVHAASLGHPIVGDRLYGRGREGGTPPDLAASLRDLQRILLHARHLGFVHPITERELAFEAPPPALFADALERLRG